MTKFELDLPTAIFCSGLTAFSVGLILLFLQSTYPKYIQGAASWSMGALLVGPTVISRIWMTEIVPSYVAVGAQNVCLIATASLFLSGTRQFFEKPLPKYFLPLVIGTSIISMWVFSAYPGAEIHRRLFARVLLIGLYSQLAWTIHQQPRTFARLLTKSVVGTLIALLVARTLSGYMLPADDGIGSHQIIQTIYAIVFSSTDVLIPICAILMANEKLGVVFENLAMRDSLASILEATVQERTIDLAQERDKARAANQAKTRFLAAASHDLRQPLTAANLFVDVLRRTNSNAQQASIITKLQASIQALGDLLDSLLQISLLDAGTITPKPSTTNCSRIFLQLESEFSALAESKNLDLTLRTPKHDPVFLADVNLLTDILRNLISNAIRYTSKGGILVGARSRGDNLVFQVFDTGVGISGSNIDKIYEEFFQVENTHRDRTKGLGLGLSIVLRLCHLLDYKISCRSELGRGSVFELILPAGIYTNLADSPPQSSTEAPDTHSFLKGLSIVLVEDDRSVAEAIHSWLSTHEARVMIFPDATQALKYLGNTSADIYISDMRLPGPLDGIEFLDAIHAKGGKKSGILITGDTSVDRVSRIASSAWPVLHKPVKGDRLIEAIRALREPDAAP